MRKLASLPVRLERYNWLAREVQAGGLRHFGAKADCPLRAKGAHGGVEPAEQPVDPLNAGKQEVTAVREGPVGDKIKELIEIFC